MQVYIVGLGPFESCNGVAFSKDEILFNIQFSKLASIESFFKIAISIASSISSS